MNLLMLPVYPIFASQHPPYLAIENGGQHLCYHDKMNLCKQLFHDQIWGSSDMLHGNMTLQNNIYKM
jgi:hypothetical protein